MYLDDSQVELAFKRLTAREDNGKVPLERTSALMYFLAFDAAVRALGVQGPLDCDPEHIGGVGNRKALELAYVRLVLLRKGSKGELRHVTTLGKIEVGGRSPEKRLSSNFLTVPLKKASEAKGPFSYPSRPAPVLSMGLVATGLSWGIDRFVEWGVNLPRLLSGVRSPTPFTDLAIFVLRDAPCDPSCVDAAAALRLGLRGRFTAELADFWDKRMGAEKLLTTSVPLMFQESAPRALAGGRVVNALRSKRRRELQRLTKSALINRLVDLEELSHH